MARRKIFFLFLATGISLWSYVRAPGISFAYPLNGTSTGGASNVGAGGLNDLISPFNNFINSVNSVGTSAIHVAPPSSFTAPITPSNGFLREGARNGLQAVDNWTHQTFGFPVSNIFLGFLHIFSWMLGAVKGGVDWVLGLFQ